MTISRSDNKISFDCNGSTTDFDFEFPIQDDDDITVTIIDSLGNETVLTKTTNYAVTAADGGFSNGGRVSTQASGESGMVAYPYADGNTILIQRSTPKTQLMDLRTGQTVDLQDIEDAFDKLQMQLLDLQETLDRCIKVPSQDSSPEVSLSRASDRASKYLTFDSEGNAQASPGSFVGITPTTFAEALLDDETAGEARATLGLNFNVVSDYASLAEAVTAMGSDQAYLYVDESVTLTQSITVPSNVTLAVPRGVLISKASTYGMTFNGSLQAGPYQVFDGFDSGDITFGLLSVVQVLPMWWGDCLPDGSTDCGPAFNKAIAASPSGGVVHIPRGKWNISTTLEIGTAVAKQPGYVSKPIHLQGSGPHSVIWVSNLGGYNAIEVGPSYDAATEIDAPTNYLCGLDWKDFSILGGESCCKSGILATCVLYSKFKNINIWLGATVAAVELDWILVSDFDLTISRCISRAFLPHVPTAPLTGIYGHVSATGGGKSIFNANRFRVNIEECSGLGMNLELYSTCGKNEISGLIQSNVDYGLQIYGGQGIHIHDLYMEPSAASQNELLLIDHNFGHIGPNVVTVPGYDGYNEVSLQNCEDTTINGLTCSRIYLHTDTERTNIMNMKLQAAAGTAALTDNGIHTRWDRRIISTQAWNPESLTTGTYTAQAFTVAGAVFGMSARAVAPYSIANLTCTAYVYAADTVVIVLHNPTGGTVDLAAGNWTIVLDYERYVA